MTRAVLITGTVFAVAWITGGLNVPVAGSRAGYVFLAPGYLRDLWRARRIRRETQP